MLLLIYAREILKEKPNAKFIADVKCSSLFFNDIRQRGGTAIMWKTGHSLIKSKLKEVSADLAGEMSGHIFFKHRFYGFDCASYCSARLAEIISNSDIPVSQLLADLPKVYNTPELRMDCNEETKFKIIEQAKPLFSDYQVDFTDGLRIEFPDGWGLVRSSNTQPILVMRFESSNPDNLKKYQDLVTEKLASIKG
jgi:phosphomannomutase/phosphoglucomutase